MLLLHRSPPNEPITAFSYIRLRLNTHSGFSTNRGIGNASARPSSAVPNICSPEHRGYSPND